MTIQLSQKLAALKEELTHEWEGRHYKINLGLQLDTPLQRELNDKNFLYDADPQCTGALIAIQDFGTSKTTSIYTLAKDLINMSVEDFYAKHLI